MGKIILTAGVICMIVCGPAFAKEKPFNTTSVDIAKTQDSSQMPAADRKRALERIGELEQELKDVQRINRDQDRRLRVLEDKVDNLRRAR